MATTDSSASSPKHKRPSREEREREIREKLEHADMGLFDRFMKRLVHTPKEEVDKGKAERN